ncbi:HEAT repeat domain-containing protein, partial [Singulisphaera rosea]
TEAAGLILRLKVRIGDGDPDVLSECLCGLLAVDPGENLGLVTEYLNPIHQPACEAAALALGRSRLPEALAPLKECWPRCLSAELRQQVLLAIAILRRSEATEHLIQLVASEEVSTAIAALFALRIFKGDARFLERVASVVHDRGDARLRSHFERDFLVE